MRRTLVLSAVVILGALSAGVAALQQPAAKFDVEKVRDNLFVIRGGGGNVAVFVQSNGVTLVDSKNPGLGGQLMAKVKELTPKPVTTIINTHTHFDHVGGNPEFPATVDIVVHDNTAANMKAMRSVTGGKPDPAVENLFKNSNGRGLATRTFKDTMTLFKGPDQIDLHYFGRGHTDGDAWVVFTALRVVHAGDIFARKGIPLLDASNGGSGVAIGDTLAKAHAGLKGAADTIITGHSTQMTMADLLEYAAFNRDFANAVREGKKAGKSVDEIAKEWTIPAKYAGYAPADPARLRMNVEVVFNEGR